MFCRRWSALLLFAPVSQDGADGGQGMGACDVIDSRQNLARILCVDLYLPRLIGALASARRWAGKPGAVLPGCGSSGPGQRRLAGSPVGPGQRLAQVEVEDGGKPVESRWLRR